MTDAFDVALRERLAALDADPPPGWSDGLRGRLAEAWQGGELVQLTPMPRRRRSSRRLWVLAAAVIGAAAIATALFNVGDSNPGVETEVPPAGGDRTTPSTSPPTTGGPAAAPDPVVNGWVAMHGDDGDLYLARPGEDARRLDVAGWETAADACPTWSPDGTRLAFGRLTGSPDADSSDAELVIVPVDGTSGTAGAPTIIALNGFETGPGFDPHPCATWAPDGRWVAFAGGGEVWLADTHSGATRRLPDLRATDLEWRPGTDELAIAGDIGPDRAAPRLSTPVTVYSVSSGELRPFGSVRAAYLAWSPDGTTLAYRGGENDSGEIRIVDADGADDRLLANDYSPLAGVGPVWSPSGDRIAFQRSIGGERSEVVLVRVADGSETVIEPPQTEGPDGTESWYPSSVTWSPDGTRLLYSGWSRLDGGCCGGRSGLIAVRADAPTSVAVLSDTSISIASYEHLWVPTQSWGRQPA